MNNNIVYSLEPNKKAAFITKNGHFINLQENALLLCGYGVKDICHSSLLKYLERNKIYEPDMIRINDGTFTYINEEAYIEIHKEPTKEQYGAILKWLDFLSLHSKKKYLYVGEKNIDCRYELMNKTNPLGIEPERIIKEIKRLYNNKSN